MYLKNKKLQRGQAIIIATVFFTIISSIISLGISYPAITQVRRAHDLTKSKQGYFLAEAGIEDAVYRVKNGLAIDASESLTLSGQSVTTAIGGTASLRTIDSEADFNGYIKKVSVSLETGTGVAFHYGVQADVGGILLENGSSVAGNVYSNGPVVGSGNLVKGDVVSAGPSGIIDDIHATSSAFAHMITGSIVDGDAYYQVKTSTTVGGVSYPGSPDQATTSMPIEDSLIDEWKAGAEAGGVTTCTGTRTINTTSTIGPRKYTCNIKLDGNATITLAGPIWAVGNINIEGNTIVNVSPSLAGQSVALVADNPSNRTTSSKVVLQNNSVYNGSGDGSYVMLVSQNNSAENGGSEIAMELKNNVEGDLLVYSGHGKVLVENNIQIKELSGYQLHLKNNAEVVYETGVASLLFSSGPGGGYTISSWKEIE